MPNAISQQLFTLDIDVSNIENKKKKTFGAMGRKVNKPRMQARQPVLSFSTQLPSIARSPRFFRQFSDPSPKISPANNQPTYHSLPDALSGTGIFSDLLTTRKPGPGSHEQISSVAEVPDHDDAVKVINEHLEWSDVSKIAMGKLTVADCFFPYAEPTKELLPANTLLYKFSNYGSLPDKRDVSPWWSSVLECQQDSGLKNRLLLAQHLKVNPLEWGRVTSVIKENWSSLEYVVFIETVTPIYGWMGGFGAFKRIDTGTKSRRDAALEPRGTGPSLPGGARQLFIPNLQQEHIRLIKVKKTLEIDPDESIFDRRET